MRSWLRCLVDRLIWLPRYPAFAEAPALFAARTVRFTLRESLAQGDMFEFTACGGRRFVSPPNNISSFVSAVFGQRDLNIHRFWRGAVRPGDVFVDVGANIGLYTVPASMQVAPGGKVICFEAHPSTFRFLVANLALNKAANAIAENLAIGAEPSEARIACDVDNPGEAHIVGAREPGQPIVQVSLDAYCAKHAIERVDYLKIDVEGYEASVLKGARGVLAANRDLLVQTEYEPKHLERYGDPSEMAELLLGMGFRPHTVAWQDGTAQPIASLGAYRGEIIWSRRVLTELAAAE